MTFRRDLGVFDATMLVVGGIIGAGIFINPAIVAARLDSAGAVLAPWVLGGAVALAGAFAYGELGALFPRAGGQYVYLTEAYHPVVGFLYAWALLFIIASGAVAAVAIVFAQYTERVTGGGPRVVIPLAIVAIMFLIDTDRFFVVSSDTLVNLNTKDPTVVTTGPASINPDTGKPYGMTFPIVTIRDFVNVQKTLLDSLGVRRLHAVIGPAMGAFQALEWAAAYPAMVERIVPIGGGAEFHAFTVGWANAWAAPITLDPRWNRGDYYGRDEPVDGLALAFKIVTLHARHPGWAQRTFARKWAAPDRDPAKSFDHKFAIEATLDQIAAWRAKVSDANSFLYLVKASQLFVAGQKAKKWRTF